MDCANKVGGWTLENVKEVLLAHQRAQRTARGAWSCTELLQRNKRNHCAKTAEDLKSREDITRL
jgi:hypothetical protein